MDKIYKALAIAEKHGFDWIGYSDRKEYTISTTGQIRVTLWKEMRKGTFKEYYKQWSLADLATNLSFLEAIVKAYRDRYNVGYENMNTHPLQSYLITDITKTNGANFAYICLEFADGGKYNEQKGGD